MEHQRDIYIANIDITDVYFSKGKKKKATTKKKKDGATTKGGGKTKTVKMNVNISDVNKSEPTKNKTVKSASKKSDANNNDVKKSASKKSKTAKLDGEAKHISFKTLSRKKQLLENPEAKELNNITNDKLCKFWTTSMVNEVITHSKSFDSPNSLEEIPKMMGKSAFYNHEDQSDDEHKVKLPQFHLSYPEIIEVYDATQKIVDNGKSGLISDVLESKPAKSISLYVLAFYEVDNDEMLFLGMVYYTMVPINGVKAKYQRMFQWTDETQSVNALFFFSPYKSIINECNVCADIEIPFFDIMMKKLEKTAIDNNCACIFTHPKYAMSSLRNMFLSNGYYEAIYRPLLDGFGDSMKIEHSDSYEFNGYDLDDGFTRVPKEKMNKMLEDVDAEIEEHRNKLESTTNSITDELEEGVEDELEEGVEDESDESDNDATGTDQEEIMRLENERLLHQEELARSMKEKEELEKHSYYNNVFEHNLYISPEVPFDKMDKKQRIILFITMYIDEGFVNERVNNRGTGWGIDPTLKCRKDNPKTRDFYNPLRTHYDVYDDDSKREMDKFELEKDRLQKNSYRSYYDYFSSQQKTDLKKVTELFTEIRNIDDEITGIQQKMDPVAVLEVQLHEMNERLAKLKQEKEGEVIPSTFDETKSKQEYDRATKEYQNQLRMKTESGNALTVARTAAAQNQNNNELQGIFQAEQRKYDAIFYNYEEAIKKYNIAVGKYDGLKKQVKDKEIRDKEISNLEGEILKLKKDTILEQQIQASSNRQIGGLSDQEKTDLEIDLQTKLQERDVKNTEVRELKEKFDNMAINNERYERKGYEGFWKWLQKNAYYTPGWIVQNTWNIFDNLLITGDVVHNTFFCKNGYKFGPEIVVDRQVEKIKTNHIENSLETTYFISFVEFMGEIYLPTWWIKPQYSTLPDMNVFGGEDGFSKSLKEYTNAVYNENDVVLVQTKPKSHFFENYYVGVILSISNKQDSKQVRRETNNVWGTSQWYSTYTIMIKTETTKYEIVEGVWSWNLKLNLSFMHKDITNGSIFGISTMPMRFQNTIIYPQERRDERPPQPISIYNSQPTNYQTEAQEQIFQEEKNREINERNQAERESSVRKINNERAIRERDAMRETDRNRKSDEEKEAKEKQNQISANTLLMEELQHRNRPNRLRRDSPPDTRGKMTSPNRLRTFSDVRTGSTVELPFINIRRSLSDSNIYNGDTLTDRLAINGSEVLSPLPAAQRKDRQVDHDQLMASVYNSAKEAQISRERVAETLHEREAAKQTPPPPSPSSSSTIAATPAQSSFVSPLGASAEEHSISPAGKGRGITSHEDGNMTDGNASSDYNALVLGKDSGSRKLAKGTRFVEGDGSSSDEGGLH